MRGVQALVFELSGPRVQLSMNLFRVDEMPPAAVVAELGRRGIGVRSEEIVGLCPAIAAVPAAAGRLLEAHLAGAVAQEGAERCHARGDAEHAALAHRLESEAVDLRDIGVNQEEVLAGAERAAALAPVLTAAGVLDSELAQMGLVAARGLRDAVGNSTGARFAKRMAALDRRLAGGA
jgi:hypothetical protein